MNDLQREVDNELSGPYYPSSESCNVLDTIVPESMEYESHISIRKIKNLVGGSIYAYVKAKLKYTDKQLCDSLSAEQVDAVALAIYNIEERKEGMIIGDQTGIGKGRVAAAIIRYGTIIGKQPIFMSEKPNLFSDIYRDLVAIQSGDLRPFIVNARDAKTNVKDEDRNIIYTAPPATEQEAAFKSGDVGGEYDYIMATYTQFASSKNGLKPGFLLSIVKDNILILDESHNASGDSNTGHLLQTAVADARGVVYLSATFAKRPDNMPVYALKTCMKEANMSSEALVTAVQNGGVALQEIISSQLVGEGQMMRRERSYEGVEVNYITLDEEKQLHRAISDGITEILRDIITFQAVHVTPLIEGMDKTASKEGKEIRERGGTSSAGVDNAPYFSKIFNTVNQMLFSIKSASVTERAITRLKEGKKVVLAFASTMGSFLENMEDENGMGVQPGDTINADFKSVLIKGLNGVMKYTVKGHDGQKEFEAFEPGQLSPEGQGEYQRIIDKIEETATGISISPIDIMITRLEDAGYRVAEVTGRKLEIIFNAKVVAKAQAAKGTSGLGMAGQPAHHIGVVQKRKRLSTNDAFGMFNDNLFDVLMINQSGSTGASAHAIVTKKVEYKDVKQRCMIIVQPELDINREVQKRGRINRTGQIIKPIYDYVSSAIPAESRLMMMLQKKLKSLDANTTSNQKQSTSILDVADFFNRFGDKVVLRYCEENTAFNIDIGDPLKLNDDSADAITEDAAMKVSGRVAVLDCAAQEKFYTEVSQQYEDFIVYLKQTDQYDLEVEIQNLEAATLERTVLVVGKGGRSAFGGDTFIEKCEVNNLRKPFTKVELDTMIAEGLQGRTGEEITGEIRSAHRLAVDQGKENDKLRLNTKYDRLIIDIPQEKEYKKLTTPGEILEFVQSRTRSLNEARGEAITEADRSSESRFIYLDKYFKRLITGSGLLYPTVTYGSENFEPTPCVFLGFTIDSRKPNPFAPSSVLARFAVASSKKYLALALSGDQAQLVNSIMTESADLSVDYRQGVIDNWAEHIKKGMANRVQRYIITGNILQGASSKGKLINFTVKGGGDRKGILLPDNYDPSRGNRGSTVSVPIGKAIDIIKGLTRGTSVVTENNLSLIRTEQGYKMIMPAGKGFKNIYGNQDLRQYLFNQRDGFEMVSGNMVGNFDWSDLPGVVKILQENSLSIPVAQDIFNKYLAHNIDDLQVEMNIKDDATMQAEADLAEDMKRWAGRIGPLKVPQAAIKPATITNMAVKLKLMKLRLQLLELQAVAA